MKQELNNLWLHRKDWQEKSKISNVSFLTGDVHHLPFGDSSFRLATCRRAAHHFSDIFRAIKEMRRWIMRWIYSYYCSLRIFRSSSINTILWWSLLNSSFSDWSKWLYFNGTTTLPSVTWSNGLTWPRRFWTGGNPSLSPGGGEQKDQHRIDLQAAQKHVEREDCLC